jgi:hypothetical protein
MKIRSVEAKLSHTDGQADGQVNMSKLIVAFRNFSGIFAQ